MASGLAYCIDEEDAWMLNLSAWSEMIDTRNRSYGTDIVHGVVLSPNRPRKASLGNLKAFPREILDEVLMFLDLDALRAVRQLNRTYFSVATNLPAYRILREHASEVLQIMHMTRTARFFNIYRIFDEFCQPYCRTCGDFGPCVFLMDFTRCCVYCLKFRESYTLVSLFDASVQYCLSVSDTKELVTIYTIPGRYGNARDVRQRRRLVRLQDILTLATKIHGSIEESIEAASTYRDDLSRWHFDAVADWQKQNAGETSTAIDELENCRQHSRRPRFPRELKVPSLESGNSDYPAFMASAHFPVWDPSKRVIQKGLYCSACSFVPGSFYSSSKQKHRAILRAYTIEQLPQHFLECEAAKVWDRRRCYRCWSPAPPPIKGDPFLVQPDGTFKKDAPI